MEQENVYSGVFLVVLLGVFFFFIYSIFITPGGRIVTYLLPALALCFMIFRGAGDIMPFKRGPLFVTDSGLQGTSIGSPKLEHGGLAVYLVAFKRSDLPPSLRKSEMGWATAILDRTCGTKTLVISANKNLFSITPPEDIENRKIPFMIRYHGRLDGGSLVHTSDMILWQKIKSMSQIIQYVATHNEMIEKTLARIVQVKTLDMDEMSQHLQTIADRVKNIKILTRRGGSDVEALGEGGGM